MCVYVIGYLAITWVHECHRLLRLDKALNNSCLLVSPPLFVFVLSWFPAFLGVQDARPLDQEDGSDEDDDGPVAPNWEPASRDANPASGTRAGGDILSMLVSIYGSKVRTWAWSYYPILANHCGSSIDC